MLQKFYLGSNVFVMVQYVGSKCNECWYKSFV